MAGADPSFDKVHLLMAVLKLHGGWKSRKELVQGLGLGEGSVRTLLGKLKDGGLVESSRRGHRLSPKGEKVVNKAREVLTGPFVLDSVKNSVAVCLNEVEVEGVLELRDHAVRSGATMALIIRVESGELLLPEQELELKNEVPELCSELESLLEPDRGMVVVCSAHDAVSAERAALSVAIEVSDAFGFVTGMG